MTRARILKMILKGFFLLNLFSLCSFLELNKIKPLEFSEQDNRGFINSTKSSIEEYAKSVWIYLQLIHEETGDRILSENHCLKVKKTWEETLKSIEISPKPKNQDLIKFREYIIETLKISLKLITKQYDEIRSPASEQTRQINKDSSVVQLKMQNDFEEIKNLQKDLQKRHLQLAQLSRKYYGVLVPEIALEKVEYLYLKSEKLYYDGNLTDALSELDKILKINKDYSKAYKLMGTIYIEKNDPKNAERAFLECLRLNLDDPEVYYEIGKLLEYQGKFKDAVNSYEVALRIKPDYVDALFKSGKLMVEHKIDKQLGEKRLKTFLDLASKDKTLSIDSDSIKLAKTLLKSLSDGKK